MKVERFYRAALRAYPTYGKALYNLATWLHTLVANEQEAVDGRATTAFTAPFAAASASSSSLRRGAYGMHGGARAAAASVLLGYADDLSLSADILDDEDEDEDEIDGKAFKGEKSEKNVRPDNDASSRRGRGPGHGRHRRGRRWRRRYVPLRPRLWRWAARTAVLGVATGALCLWRVRLNGGNPPMFRYNANRFALEPYDGTVPLELTGQ